LQEFGSGFLPWQLIYPRYDHPMSRKPRIHYPGALYHVILRGNAGQPVFSDEADRSRFFLLLQEGTCRFGYRVHTFCLMSNHIHMLLQVGNLPLSKGMHNLAFRFTRWMKCQGQKPNWLIQFDAVFNIEYIEYEI